MDHTWWGSLSPVQHLYWIIAIPATVILFVQLILAFISGFEFHMGSDLGAHHAGDVGAPHFQLLTLRNVVAFFSVFGWTGLALKHAGVSNLFTILISFSSGLLMMIIMTSMFVGLSKLQSDGTIMISGAKGLSAQIYLTVPSNRTGFGKIEVVLQGRKIELDALTDDLVDIPTGSNVKILDIINNQAIVERI